MNDYFAYSGLLLGFAGSFHCIGMCGPIAVALPRPQGASELKFFGGKLLYNSGRIVSYSIIGLLFGSVGAVVRISGFQEMLSIVSGVLLIFGIIFPVALKRLFPRFQLGSYYAKYIQNRLSQFYHRRTLFSLALLGVVNGFLPCGFVYVAVAGALNQSSLEYSVAFMMFFGIGTLPAMLGISLFSHYVNDFTKKIFRRASPIVAVIFGVAFIMRGMGLDIPYLSPKLQVEKPLESDCCRPLQ